jgi:hypothetical protein
VITRPTDLEHPCADPPSSLLPALVLVLSGCLAQDQDANDNPPP